MQRIISFFRIPASEPQASEARRSASLTAGKLYSMLQDVLLDKKLKIADAFNHQLGLIFKSIESKFRTLDHDLILLRDRIKLAKASNPCQVIDRCETYIWDMKERIMTRDDSFFLKYDEKKHSSAISSVIISIKGLYGHFSVAERTYLWDCIVRMLALVADYKELKSLASGQQS